MTKVARTSNQQRHLKINTKKTVYCTQKSRLSRTETIWCKYSGHLLLRRQAGEYNLSHEWKEFSTDTTKAKQAGKQPLLLGRWHPSATMHELTHGFVCLYQCQHPQTCVHILTPWDFNLDLGIYYHVMTQYSTMQSRQHVLHPWLLPETASSGVRTSQPVNIKHIHLESKRLKTFKESERQTGMILIVTSALRKHITAWCIKNIQDI